MFKRVVGAGFFSVVCILFMTGLFAPQANAAGEKLEWVDYTTIGASGGEIDKTFGNSEGGSFILEFKQTSPPAVFVAEAGEDNCQGRINLRVNDDESGTITPGQQCPALKDIASNIMISGGSVLIARMKTDASTIRDAAIDKICAEDDSLSEEDCEKQGQRIYTEAIRICQTTANYDENALHANAYLDCLAEKLGVERPDAADSSESDGSQSGEDAGSISQCTIPDLGWLVCQVLQFTAWITDNSFELLKPWLEVEPLKEQVDSTDPDSEDTPMYAAWKLFRNIANVFFVFVFIVLILSYVTNVGLGAYNIKKLLPRMIVATLLVNMSFFFCALAVDLSNILGGTLKNTLTEMTPPESGSEEYRDWATVTGAVISITPTDEEFTQNNMPECDDDTAQEIIQQNRADRLAIGNNPDAEVSEDTATCRLTDTQAEEAGEDATPPIAGATDDNEEDEAFPQPTKMLMGGIVITGMRVLYANLSVLVPMMTAALIAILILLMILIIRQVILIVIIVISPIALALYLLPNTKDWASRWFDIFTKFLLIYPVVALLFGASYIASRVVAEQASSNGQTLLAMFSLGIQVIPLFITPVILTVGGGMLNRFAGVVNNPNKGPFDAMKRGAANYRGDRKNIRDARRAGAGAELNKGGQTKTGKLRSFVRGGGVLGATGRRTMSKKAGEAQLDSELSSLKKQYLGTTGAIKSNGDPVLTEMLEETKAEASEAAHHVDMQAVNAAMLRMNEAGLGQKDLSEAAINGTVDPEKYKGSGPDGSLTEAERAAAAQKAANTATVEEAEEMISQSGNMTPLVRQAMAEGLRKNQDFRSGAKHFGGSALNQVAEGGIQSESDIQNAMVRAVNSNGYGVEAIAQQDSHTIANLNSLMSHPDIKPEAKAQLNANINAALADGKINVKMTPETQAELRKLSQAASTNSHPPQQGGNT